MKIMTTGLDKAWSVLEALEPDGVCREAGVTYGDGSYRVKSLGLEFALTPVKRLIRGISLEAESVKNKQAYFLDLALLWYLTSARNIGETGKHLRPQNLKGGHHFFTGAHELPLKELAAKYGSDRAGFISRGLALGGRALSYGDASVEVRPLPRVPVTMILWVSDEEFPARADLLFDSSAEYQARLDILWSAAMLAALGML